MKRSVSLHWLACLGILMATATGAEKLPATDEALIEFFEKEVRPILVSRCFECHSGSEKTTKGGLRLDSRDAVLKGGDTGPAVSLEDPSTSLFVSSINYGDLYQMPPKSKLPANEIAVLTKWIEKGIPWPAESASAVATVKTFDIAARATQHWCWQPVTETSPPAVKQSNWPATNFDRFILSKLETAGLNPAPQADKGVLLRRVYFDLIGLPPTPDEVEQFARDTRPNALEPVVDRLLESVHFGERWARHWLDLTRYAETRGHEFEPIIPNAWQYRDYVIRAINADVPYDRFLTEQIAGDLIAPRWRTSANSASPAALPINESLIGTGFWFLGEEVHSPVDIRKDETDRVDNRLDVMSKTFLGLTLACARCHDHKFDAISQKDYYALAGFVISSNYRQIRVDTFEQHQQIAQKLNSIRNNSSAELAKSIADNARPVLEKLDQYWIASRRVLDAGLTTFASLAPGQPLTSEVTELVDRVAKETSLDSELLARWCVEMNFARRDTHHPFYRLITPGPNDATPPTTQNPNGTLQGLVVDFGDTTGARPIQDGVSFGIQPVKRGQLVSEGSAESPRLGVATIGGWNRDLFWKKISLAPGTEVDNGTLGAWQMPGRMVRTPEFNLKTRNLWYLVRGSVRAYANVNSHLIIVGPLHGSLLREFKQIDDHWHWVSHGLDLYKDHRLHVEFSPADDGPCSIAMVVQSDEQPKLPEANWQSLDQAALQANSAQAAAVKSVFQSAVRLLLEVNNSTLTSASGSTASDSAELADWFVKHQRLFSLKEIDRPSPAVAEAEAELAKDVRWDSSLAPAIMDGNGVNEHLLVRGNSITPKDTVSRRFLEAVSYTQRQLTPKTGDADFDDSSSGRLQLAQKMLESPLAARVTVNRVWHHLFARGIVPTVDNMGVLGLPPSHPELLDYLSVEFVRNGWSMKRLIRSLVLSRTYQMSSHPTEADAVDPNNELWHRMPIKRLEGEAIRDSILAVSGSLNRTPFGPSVPIYLTEFMQGRGRPGASGPLDGNGRRSIYISVRRNFLSPMMLAFDTPNPFSTVGRRTVSNVPAQALILMNDPFVVEQANLWAERLSAESTESLEHRIDRMYLTAFARHASATESADAIQFLKSQGVNSPDQQREAWNNLCHVLFNVKEFVFVE